MLRRPLAFSVFMLSLSTSSNPVSAALKEYHFEVEAKLGSAYSPDCQNTQAQRRYLFLAEDSLNNVSASLPGPLIEADEGDTIRVTLTNRHKVLSATIHYHGIHQMGTPWSDGPRSITQCGLGPRQSQVYEFQAYPPGTHFWHAHQSMIVADGMAGPIIVHPKDPEPFEYEEDRMLFLNDFYIQTGSQQQAGLDNFPFTWVGNPDSLLINGLGLASKCQEGGSDFGDEDACLVNVCNDTLAYTPSIPVESGKTYRFRVINGASLVMMNLAISGHNMTIIEVDGTLVDPVTVQNYDLSPGQRASVLVSANQESGSFWIETVIRERNIPGITGRAIITYNGANATIPPSDGLPSHPEWDDTEAGVAIDSQLTTQNISLYEEEATALLANESDVDRYVLVGTQNTRVDEDGNTIQLRWAVNNVSFTFPAEPLIGTAVAQARQLGWPLEESLEGTMDLPRNPPTNWNWTQSVNDAGGPGGNLDSSGTTVIRLVKGDIVELVFQNARALNGAAEFHPWHLHGHSFWIVGRGAGVYDEERDVPTYNLDNPTLRDTFTLWPLEWVAIRFIANNPGAWFFHCHLISHEVMGMGFAIVVSPEEIGTASESVAFCDQNSLGQDSALEDGDDDNANGDSSESASMFQLIEVFVMMVSTLIMLAV